MSVKTIDTGYRPREFVKDVKLHERLKRFNVLVMHRRFGKTVFSLNHKIDKALKNPLHNPQYAYIAPTYGQSKRVSWDYLKQYTSSIPGMQPNEADLRIDIPCRQGERIRFMLLGAENPMALKGIYLDGVILDEYAEMNPAVWREVIRPTLSDRLGWAMFIGTPKGQNSFHDLYHRACSGEDEEWFGAMYKASETGIISPQELESARREMTEEEFLQEYECSFAAGLVGAYFGKEMEKAEQQGRITEVPYDPALPVDTFWDLGINDTTCIWFIQRLGSQVRAIDYVEENGAGLDYFARQLYKERDYYYGTHFLPHDAKARELGSGKTREETLRKLGVRPTRIIPRQAKEDQISAARLLLPRVYFDRKKTERGVKCLKNYQRKWDPKNNVFSMTPLHNWASNGADAFQQAAIGLKDEPQEQDSSYAREAESDYDVFTHAGRN